MNFQKKGNMINIRLAYNRGYEWFSKNDIFVKGYILTFDDRLLRNNDLVNYFSGIHSFSDFRTKLQQANGLFSVIIKKQNTLWAASDTTRSFPLFYYQGKDFVTITDNPDMLKEDNIPMILDEDSAVLFTCSGFVGGGKTLLKDVFLINAGESLCYENNLLKKEFFMEFLTETFFMQTREESKEKLKSVLNNAGKRLVQILNNRPVAIPLSGGFDSRLMAYLLRKNNYKNVVCYTFGKKNNVEVNNAKRTAKNLGYEWYFADYEKYFDKSLLKDPLFRDYVDFSLNYIYRIEEQDYYAVKELVELNKLPANTVFIPGNSGAIAGHLLDKKMKNSGFSFSNHALNDVYSLVYPRKKETQIIRKEVDFLDNPNSDYPAYLLYENWRFQATTAMTFNNTSKLWEFFGFEYLLPLWDKELFAFFLHLPFRYKYDKNLYKETLTELFEEYNIYFKDDELYFSERLSKKMTFRSKLKSCFPFLKYFVNIWKIDNLGSQYFAKEFITDLKKTGECRKYLSFNGIFSAWCLLQIKKKLQNEKNH